MAAASRVKKMRTEVRVTHAHTHTHTHTHNHFMALLDFVQDYPSEPAPER